MGRLHGPNAERHAREWADARNAECEVDGAEDRADRGPSRERVHAASGTRLPATGTVWASPQWVTMPFDGFASRSAAGGQAVSDDKEPTRWWRRLPLSTNSTTATVTLDMLLLHLSDAITALRLSLSKMTEARDFVVGLHSQACRGGVRPPSRAESAASPALCRRASTTDSCGSETRRGGGRTRNACGWCRAPRRSRRGGSPKSRARCATGRSVSTAGAILDAEGEAHGRTCEKSPQRKLGSRAGSVRGPREAAAGVSPALNR